MTLSNSTAQSGNDTNGTPYRGNKRDGSSNDTSELTSKKLREGRKPLHIVKITDDMEQVKILEGHSLLSDLLNPLDECTFMSTYFRDSAVHVPSRSGGIRSEEVAERLFNLDPEAILSETASDRVFCWLKNTDGRLTSVSVDAATGTALHQAGNATYCRAPHDLEQILVGRMLRDTGYGCGQYDPTGEKMTSLGRGEVEILIGTTGHKTGWHTDFQENFTIQLSGSKRWRVQRGTVSHTVRALTPHYQDPGSVESQLIAGRLGDSSLAFGSPKEGQNAEGPVETLVMKPGDFLYFPAGMWHEVETLEQGVSLNISLMGRTYANLVAQTIEHVLLRDDRWRERVTNCPGGTGGAVENLEKLLELLPGIVESFCQQGGARAILPPCLTGSQQPNHDTKMSEADSEDSDEEESTFLSPPYAVPETNSLNFEGYQERFRSCGLRRSSLASLLRQDEVSQYYYPEDDGENIPSNEILILNVNFAGNETLEPMFRHVFHHTGGKLVSLLLNNQMEFTVDDIDWVKDLDILNAFVYYGLLVWVAG